MTHPGGRPTNYRPEYCDMVIEFMADGYSVAAFAGHIRTTRQTIYNWANEHPEFFDALKTAQAMAARWWEDALRNVAITGQGNATAAIFALKNRGCDEWRDKQELDHTSSDGSMTPKPAVELTDEQLEKIIAGK
jgi:hypothetical protein